MQSVYSSLNLLGHQDTRWGSLTSLQRCSRCILVSTYWATRTRVGVVLPLCRDAVGVFYSLSRRGQGVIVHMRVSESIFVRMCIDSRSEYIWMRLCIVLTCKHSWCNGYRRRKWTWQPKFKSGTRLSAFYIIQTPLKKYESSYCWNNKTHWDF